MSTNAPDHALPRIPFGFAEPAMEPIGLLERLLRRIQCTICGLHGHDSVLQYEGTRMFLRCMSCGYESPGWDVSPSRALRRQLPPRPAVSRPLSVARRVA